MALSSRGKALVAGVAVVSVLGGGVAALILTDNGAAKGVLGVIPGVDSGPAPCPLTNEPFGKDKEPPSRPALAVKVENTPDAMPLAGLDQADIVYEEVVEGGITRFVVVFHCGSTDRVGPVRSARTTDPKILVQFGAHPILAYSGGVNQVVEQIKAAGIIGLTEGDPASAFSRDDVREMPHNLFTDTAKLWPAGHKRAKDEPAPEAVFSYGDLNKPNKKATSVTIDFPLTAVEWQWEGGRWVRYQDGSAMTLEDGTPIATDNVVIQQVETTESDIVDVAGYPSPEVAVTGTGKAWLLRNGKLITGRWERDSEGDLTTFVSKSGDEFQLTNGTAFVELAPTGMFTAPVSFGP